MSKINNKLIIILAILVFVFGLSLFSPAYALADTIMPNGVIPFPYTPSNQSVPTIIYSTSAYPATTYYYQPVSPAPVATVPVMIPGCDGRTTGFSTVNGQSCYGNYVNTPPIATVQNPNTVAYAPSNTVKKDASVATTNDNLSSLTANALIGSNSFMPSGLIQWIFFAILVVLIIFLWRYVFAKEKYMSEPLKHS